MANPIPVAPPWLRTCLDKSKMTRDELYLPALYKLPMTCLNYHVISTEENFKKYTDMKRRNAPLDDILNELGFTNEKRLCCRTIFMSI